jgi:hypothetical protein
MDRANSKRMMAKQERRQLFVAAFFAWLSVSFGVAGAPVARAGYNEAHLSVSALVVSTCKISTHTINATYDVNNSLEVACGNTEAVIEHGAKRTLNTPEYSGDVMVATINF